MNKKYDDYKLHPTVTRACFYRRISSGRPLEDAISRPLFTRRKSINKDGLKPYQIRNLQMLQDELDRLGL